MRKTPKFNKKKAKEAILYILSKKLNNMDEKKLQLLLYFIDFDYYEKHEEGFLGFTYKKK